MNKPILREHMSDFVLVKEKYLEPGEPLCRGEVYNTIYYIPEGSELGRDLGVETLYQRRLSVPTVLRILRENAEALCNEK